MTQPGLAVETKTWSIVANITAPIWDAGLTRARVKQARAEVGVELLPVPGLELGEMGRGGRPGRRRSVSKRLHTEGFRLGR